MRARAILVAASIFRPADSGRTEYVLRRSTIERTAIVSGVAPIGARCILAGGEVQRREEKDEQHGDRLHGLLRCGRAHAKQGAAAQPLAGTVAVVAGDR